MEAVYYAARANLRRLLIAHPSWTRAQFAQATGMSRSWVDKWKKRLLSVPLDDEQVLYGLSRAPHHPPPRLDPEVIDRLLEIRDDPPEGLGRTPGPKTILYYLKRDETLKEMKLCQVPSKLDITIGRVKECAPDHAVEHIGAERGSPVLHVVAADCKS